MSVTSPWQTSRSSARVLRRTSLAWDVKPDDLDLPDKSNETRFPELIGFALLAFPALAVAGLPASELAAGGICLVAVSRPASTATSYRLLALGPALLVGWLALTSVAHDVIDVRRLLHLVVWATLAYVLASGRVHLPSAAKGLTLGLVIAIGTSAAGLSPSGYTGRLSGFIGDPNGGGYTIVVLGFVALALLSPGRARQLLLAVIAVAVVLTYSRTTLIALTFALVWVLVGRRIGRLPGVALIGAMAYAVTHIPDQLRLFGPFSDRTGSDELRERLIAQENLDVALSRWTGAGAGTAHVEIEGNTFYYHSSYLALQREGGMVAVVLLSALIVLIALVLLREPAERRGLWAEAALIGTMICAINVGEVLLELPTAVAIGVAVHHLRSAPRPSDHARHADRPALRAAP